MAMLRSSTKERMSGIVPEAFDHWPSLKDQHYLTQEWKEVIKAFYASLNIPTLDIGFTIIRNLSALSIQLEERCKLLPQAKVIKSIIRNLPPSHEEEILKAFLYLHLTLRIKPYRLYPLINKEKFGPSLTIVADECAIYVNKQQLGKYPSYSELIAAQLMLHHVLHLEYVNTSEIYFYLLEFFFSMHDAIPNNKKARKFLDIYNV